MQLVKNIIKHYRIFLRRLIAAMPHSMRGNLIRRLVSVNYFPDDDIVFKLAETKEELESAFALLHDSYVASKFMKPHPSGMRATIYHALPTTTTLIAKVRDKVVGTLSIVQDNSLGLPLEKVFDIDPLRKKSPHIAEISALAIHPDYRGNKGLLFLLTKFMYEYSTKYFYLDYWVIAVNPAHKELYEHIFLFDPLPDNPKKIDNYEFVNNQPAVGYYCEIKYLKKKFYVTYCKQPPEKNLYDYFDNPAIRMKNFKYPDRLVNQAFDAVMDREIFEEIFVKKTNLISTLRPEEIMNLRVHYVDSAEILELLPLPNNVQELRPRRGHTRFKVVCRGYLQNKDTGIAHTIEVLDLSISGFKARISDPEFLSLNNLYRVTIKLGPYNVEELEARLVSFIGENNLGFTVEASNKSWENLISQLFRNLYKKKKLLLSNGNEQTFGDLIAKTSNEN